MRLLGLAVLCIQAPTLKKTSVQLPSPPLSIPLFIFFSSFFSLSVLSFHLFPRPRLSGHFQTPVFTTRVQCQCVPAAEEGVRSHSALHWLRVPMRAVSTLVSSQHYLVGHMFDVRHNHAFSVTMHLKYPNPAPYISDVSKYRTGAWPGIY